MAVINGVVALPDLDIDEASINDFDTVLAPSSGVLEIDLSEGRVVLGALNASVTEWDFINVPTGNGKVISVTVLLEGNSTYTYGSDVSVNTVSVPAGVLWSGGSAPTSSDGNDILTFVISRDAAGDIKVFGTSSLDHS